MISQKMIQLGQNRSTIRELFEFGKQRKAEIGEENVFDFSIGNPSVPPPEAVNEAIRRFTLEREPTALHGYTSAAGDIGVRETIAAGLRQRFGFSVDAEHLYMTCGAAASLTISLHALVNAGDEVIVLAPFFPEYRVFVEKAGAELVTVLSEPETFQIDLEALSRAITPKTKAIIVNSPNNPSGVVLSEDSLQKLATLLRKKEAEFSTQIYVLADDPYRELVYGDTKATFFPKFYPRTLVCYSYSKALSLPGERIGYIMVSPQMPEHETVFSAVCGAGRALGFVCAPSLFQYVIGACDGLTPDLVTYDKNRTLLMEGLRNIGYQTANPDGAFYLFMKVPTGDAKAFSECAKEYNLLLVPSDDFGYPGYVRIAYCVHTEQIERAMPAFEKLYQHVLSVETKR